MCMEVCMSGVTAVSCPGRCASSAGKYAAQSMWSSGANFMNDLQLQHKNENRSYSASKLHFNCINNNISSYT